MNFLQEMPRSFTQTEASTEMPRFAWHVCPSKDIHCGISQLETTFQIFSHTTLIKVIASDLSLLLHNINNGSYFQFALNITVGWAR
jgi:hypothetical protein